MPKYAVVPRWGLLDPRPATAVDQRDAVDPTDSLRRTLAAVTWVLALAAAVHLIRYVIAVVNRTIPISVWLDLLSGIAVLVFGTFAFAGMLLALAAFVRWVLDVRLRAYADTDLRDPRPRWQQLLLAALPLVNIVGGPLLLSEAARCGEGADRADARIRRIAIAWAIVNGVALLAIGYRIGGWFSDSLQVHADGLAVVTVSLAVSAVFTYWAAPRLAAVLTGPVHESQTERRLVAA